MLIPAVGGPSLEKGKRASGAREGRYPSLRCSGVGVGVGVRGTVQETGSPLRVGNDQAGTAGGQDRAPGYESQLSTSLS